MGDGVLAEFHSAVTSVECALEIQQCLAAYNATAAADEQIQVRIGVHLGDVVVVGDDILGDGVNIASRIEPLAPPGGICISQDVYNGIIKKGEAREHTLLVISRVATLVVGALGLVLALTTSDMIYYIVSYAWAGIGCSFAPAILLSFYWDRFGSVGVVTALTAGLVTTVVWIVTGLDQQVTARAVTFFVAMGLAVTVTLAEERSSNT